MRASLRSRLRPPDARWGHAARVALAATAVVGVVALLLAVVVNTVLLHRLDREVEARLGTTLAAAASGRLGSTGAGDGQSGGDVDDAPVFVWQVSPDGTVEALTVGAPDLPVTHWTAGTRTAPIAGRNFRLAAAPEAGGWLVAGESVAAVSTAAEDLLVVELVLGALLLVVTFTGSFVVGLRASAPIEQVRRRQAEFTADASHELRTPLSVIEAEVDLALGLPRTADEYEAVLVRIGSESGRLRAIVEDLLWLARADGAAPGADRLSAVDVAAVADTTVARFHAVAEAGGFSLTARTAPSGTALVRADAEGMDRLVGVLVDNAARYAGPGGAVEVSVTAAGGRVTLRVDDSGPGIPEDQRDLVFDRFHRFDVAPGGTGLGLAIADAVVRASSGTWDVGTSPLGGARFQVTWRPADRTTGSGTVDPAEPAAPAHPADPAAPAGTVAPTGSVGSATGPQSGARLGTR